MVQQMQDVWGSGTVLVSQEGLILVDRTTWAAVCKEAI